MKRPNISRTTVYVGMLACLVVVMTAFGIHAIEPAQPAPSATVSPITPPATPKPASTPAATQPTVVGEPALRPGAAAAATVSEATLRLYMPDGQLKSHSIRVYVSRNIQPDQAPRLRLLRSHAVTKRAVDEARLWEPGLVAPNQEWIESVEGAQVRRTGTLLLFDLGEIPFGLRAMLRVLPIVSWTEGGTGRIAVGDSDVNVGNIVAAIGWTAAIVGLALLVVIGLSWKAGSNPILLLTGADGHLSLAQTQVAFWTVAMGSVLLGYGLIRLQLPTIPPALLVLMGASLTTGGLGYFKDAQKQQAAVAAGVTPVQRALTMGDLVRVFTAGQEPELSLAKAQMLFWTLLLLVLFISKSILDGAIWEVPWPLVALMGFSQAGYLAPKLVSQP
jgi:hypothetical protein